METLNIIVTRIKEMIFEDGNQPIKNAKYLFDERYFASEFVCPDCGKQFAFSGKCFECWQKEREEKQE